MRDLTIHEMEYVSGGVQNGAAFDRPQGVQPLPEITVTGYRDPWSNFNSFTNDMSYQDLANRMYPDHGNDQHATSELLAGLAVVAGAGAAVLAVAALPELAAALAAYRIAAAAAGLGAAFIHYAEP